MAPRVYPLLTVAERLAMLRKLQGAWKHRKPDPLEELKEIKKGWDRKLPHLR
ncbi:hypothetical protein HYZ64_02695 [Candidatus Berkelbacteria bacterium]|nr:hypothetical protein [Candidatus Berkelbacteria bacterium]